MKLTITSGQATVENAWGLIGNVVWSGDKQRSARSVTFLLASSDADPNLPAVACPVGSIVSFWDDDGSSLFQGIVVTRTLSDQDAAVSVTAHDRGMYLANNDGTIKVRDETAESAVRRLCSQYGIAVGTLATTGIPLRRKFSATPLWNIITTLYTLAGQQTGQQYLARFSWDQLTVSVRSEIGENLVIRPKSNLLSSTTTQSIENMRNSVGIYDKDGNRLSTIQDSHAVGLYGLLETHITQREGHDSSGEAQQILVERGLSQTVTVECMGNTRLTTGRTVIVQQPVLGLSGVFWIESDRHVWKDGNYITTLVLNLRNVGYQTETGSDLT